MWESRISRQMNFLSFVKLVGQPCIPPMKRPFAAPTAVAKERESREGNIFPARRRPMGTDRGAALDQWEFSWREERR